MPTAFRGVQFGEATAYPHGVPHPQTLVEGDMVLVDTGCILHGYRSDITRTYVFGDPTPRQREIWDLEQRAQLAGFAAADLVPPARRSTTPPAASSSPPASAPATPSPACRTAPATASASIRMRKPISSKAT